MFFYLSTLLFSGFLETGGNFVGGQKQLKILWPSFFNHDFSRVMLCLHCTSLADNSTTIPQSDCTRWVTLDEPVLIVKRQVICCVLLQRLSRAFPLLSFYRSTSGQRAVQTTTFLHRLKTPGTWRTLANKVPWPGDEKRNKQPTEIRNLIFYTSFFRIISTPDSNYIPIELVWGRYWANIGRVGFLRFLPHYARGI